jgi:hypothetical protein
MLVPGAAVLKAQHAAQTWRPSSRSTSSPGRPTRGRAAGGGARSRGTHRSVADRSLAPRIVAIRLAHVGELQRQAALGGVAAGRALAGIRWAHAPAAARMLRVPPGDAATAPAAVLALPNGYLGDHQTSLAPASTRRNPRSPTGNCNFPRGHCRRDRERPQRLEGVAGVVCVAGSAGSRVCGGLVARPGRHRCSCPRCFGELTRYALLARTSLRLLCAVKPP